MNTVYDVSTKDNSKISYCSFIQTTLLNLGLSPSSKGTYYLRDIILLAIQEDKFEDINLKHLQNKLAKNKNILPSTIKTNKEVVKALYILINKENVGMHNIENMI